MNSYRKLSKLQKELAIEVVDFFVAKYMPRMRTLSIRVVGTDLSKENIDGDCDFLDIESRTPREFVIRVNKSLSIKDFIETLLHELVHVKQWAKGEMREMWRYHMTRSWKGEAIDINKVKYRDHPWEKEAYALQGKLTKEFLNK